MGTAELHHEIMASKMSIAAIIVAIILQILLSCQAVGELGNCHRYLAAQEAACGDKTSDTCRLAKMLVVSGCPPNERELGEVSKGEVRSATVSKPGASTTRGLMKAIHGKCLDAPGRNTNGGKVHMRSCDPKNQNQQWTYTASSKQMKATHGKCLDAPQRNTNGGKVRM